jgi:hypothetical protein
MTNNDLYNALLRILRKESKGLAVSPDAFTDLLQVENLTLYNEYYKGFEVNQKVTDSLQKFKKVSELDLTYKGDYHAMRVALPSDYRHCTGLYVGADKLSFTWANSPGDPGTDEGFAPQGFDTLTASSTDLTSVISLGNTECTCHVAAFAADAGDYVFTINITDNAITPASDMPTLYIYDYLAGIGYTELKSQLLIEGEQHIEFTSTQDKLAFELHLATASTCDLTVTFDLYEDDTEFIPIDLVTDEEWMFRRNDELTEPTTSYPIARIADDYIYVVPKEINNIFLYYLKQPDTPYFDYYTDDDYNIQYLAVSSTHVLTTSEVYRDGTASGTVTSISVELEWNDEDKIKILHRILAKMGVSMDEQLVAQYATSKENA